MGGSFLEMSSPLGPQTTILSASLGQSELSCMLETEVFVQCWAAGRWQGIHRQPGFPMECSGHLLSKPEGQVYGETQRGSFLFNLVANRSSWGLSQSLEICLKICGERDHSVDWIWFLLQRPSAITLSEPATT